MPLERPESPPGRASRHTGPPGHPERQDRAVAASQAIPAFHPDRGVGGPQPLGRSCQKKPKEGPPTEIMGVRRPEQLSIKNFGK